jgi:uncharacterized protein
MTSLRSGLVGKCVGRCDSINHALVGLRAWYGGAIHIVNYYRDATLNGGQSGAPERAISHAVMPCTLAAVTTAIGLLSLCSSNILPIRKFGIFSAMGVMATLVLLYTFLPSALTIFPAQIQEPRQNGAASHASYSEFLGNDRGVHLATPLVGQRGLPERLHRIGIRSN